MRKHLFNRVWIFKKPSVCPKENNCPTGWPCMWSTFSIESIWSTERLSTIVQKKVVRVWAEAISKSAAINPSPPVRHTKVGRVWNGSPMNDQTIFGFISMISLIKISRFNWSAKVIFAFQTCCCVLVNKCVERTFRFILQTHFRRQKDRSLKTKGWTEYFHIWSWKE